MLWSRLFSSKLIFLLSVFALCSCANLKIGQFKIGKKEVSEGILEEFIIKSRVLISTKWEDKERPKIKGVMYEYVREGALSGLRLTGLGPLNSKLFDLMLTEGKLFFYHSDEPVTYILGRDDVIYAKERIDVHRMFDELVEVILPDKTHLKMISCPLEVVMSNSTKAGYECFLSSKSRVVYFYQNGMPEYAISAHALIRYEGLEPYGEKYFPRTIEVEFKDIPLVIRLDVKEHTIESTKMRDFLFDIQEFQARPFISLASKLSNLNLR